MKKVVIKSVFLSLFAGGGITGWMMGTVFDFSPMDALLAVIATGFCSWCLILPAIFPTNMSETDNERMEEI